MPEGSHSNLLTKTVRQFLRLLASTTPKLAGRSQLLKESERFDNDPVFDDLASFDTMLSNTSNRYLTPA
jgi:hypothetical protein